MSDRPGLSIFDDDPAENSAASGADDATQVIPAARQSGPAPAARPSTAGQPATGGSRPGFPVVRRGGYDPAAVDRQMHALAGEKAGLEAGLNDAKAKIAALEKQVAALKTEVAENKNPTYAGLGGRASEMLRLAEEQADEVLAHARGQADELLRRARKDGEALKAQAARDAEDMRMVQLKELDEKRSKSMNDVEQERALAKSEAEDVLASARREAEQLRLAAEQETNALRTSAKREAEQARAAADREVQEARRTLAVEKERLTREAAEHHSTATAETDKLVKEAEERANAAERRARDAMAQANSQRQQAQEEAERLLSHARREAEQVVSSAQTQAQSFTAAGEAEAERELAALHAEVDRYARRRDAIVAQLGALRDVVAGFADDPAPAEAEIRRRGARRREVSAPDLRAGRVTRDGRPGRAAEVTTPLHHRSPFAVGFLGALGALLAFWLGGLLLSIGSTLVLVVVALFLAVGLNPLVEYFESRGLSRNWSVLTVILIVVAALALFLVALVPVIADQVSSIVANAPDWFHRLQHNHTVQRLDSRFDIIDRAQTFVTGANFGKSVFGGVVGVGVAVLTTLANTFVVIVLTLYFLASLPTVKRSLYRLAPASKRGRVGELSDQILSNVGSYVSGAFVVAMCAGVASLVFLLVVGLGQYAVALAAVVALLDVIPMIGATLGAVIVTAIGFATDPKIGLACLVFYVVYQQFENYVIYPKVMARSVDIPGSVIVIAALAGAGLLGVVGALLAIPTAAAILLLVREVVLPRQQAR